MNLKFVISVPENLYNPVFSSIGRLFAIFFLLTTAPPSGRNAKLREFQITVARQPEVESRCGFRQKIGLIQPYSQCKNEGVPFIDRSSRFKKVVTGYRNRSGSTVPRFGVELTSNHVTGGFRPRSTTSDRFRSAPTALNPPFGKWIVSGRISDRRSSTTGSRIEMRFSPKGRPY